MLSTLNFGISARVGGSAFPPFPGCAGLASDFPDILPYN